MKTRFRSPLPLFIALSFCTLLGSRADDMSGATNATPATSTPSTDSSAATPSSTASSTNTAPVPTGPIPPFKINVDRSAFQDLKLSPSVISLAESQKLAFGGGNKGQNGAQRQAYGIYMDALMAATSGDPQAVGALVDQIRDLIAPGHEPDAAAGLDGWTHHAIAQAFVLAKNTPEVWSKLSDDDQNRMDWIMKAMAVAGHFQFDDGNDYNTSLHADDNTNKAWNPNHRLYLFVVLSAAAYFGPDQLNDIYTSFSYDDYMKKFDELGFSNIKAVWSCYDWKPILENGGVYNSPKRQKPMGTGTGVRHPFTYQKIPLADMADIYCATTENTYGQTVINGVEGKSWILNNGISPFVGQKGMISEFNSHDAEGIRSDIDYCNEDFCAYPTMLLTLKVLGLWPATERTKNLEKLMYVGNEDFLYKNNTGFHSFSHGKGDSKPLDQTKWLAFSYIQELWNNYLKNAIKPQGM